MMILGIRVKQDHDLANSGGHGVAEPVVKAVKHREKSRVLGLVEVAPVLEYGIQVAGELYEGSQSEVPRG